MLRLPGTTTTTGARPVVPGGRNSLPSIVTFGIAARSFSTCQ